MEKLREIVIKDNGAFGSWDYDMLANEWDDLPLSDWGIKGVPMVELSEVAGGGAKEFSASDFDELMTMKFKFDPGVEQDVREKLEEKNTNYSKAILEIVGYEEPSDSDR
jgi:hypothetical protein